MEKKKKKEILIFCQAYTQIKVSLCIISKNIENSSIIVIIPSIYNLYKFFVLLNKRSLDNKINVLYIERYNTEKPIKRNIWYLIFFLSHLLKEKKYLNTFYNTHLRKYNNTTLYFFSRHFTDYSFSFIDKLKLKNDLIYIPDKAADLLPEDSSYPNNIYEFMRLLICKIIYTKNAVLIDVVGEKVISISSKYLDRYTFRRISRKKRDIIIESLNMNQFKLFNKAQYDVLYLGHNALNIRSSKKEWEKTLMAIYDVLRKYIPENKIASKMHPGRINDISVNMGKELDPCIPAEFLFNENIKIYITPYSSSISTLKNGIVISLIDMIPTNNYELRSKYKERFKAMGLIDYYFPSSVNDFEGLLKSII